MAKGRCPANFTGRRVLVETPGPPAFGKERSDRKYAYFRLPLIPFRESGFFVSAHDATR